MYPFTLEQHVVALQPQPHVAIAERRARLAAVLHARELAEEQKEKEALHRVAPGYNPQTMLMPTSTTKAEEAAVPESTGPVDPMDELVARLEEMEQGK